MESLPTGSSSVLSVPIACSNLARIKKNPPFTPAAGHDQKERLERWMTDCCVQQTFREDRFSSSRHASFASDERDGQPREALDTLCILTSTRTIWTHRETRTALLDRTLAPTLDTVWYPNFVSRTAKSVDTTQTLTDTCTRGLFRIIRSICRQTRRQHAQLSRAPAYYYLYSFSSSKAKMGTNRLCPVKCSVSLCDNDVSDM